MTKAEATARHRVDRCFALLNETVDALRLLVREGHIFAARATATVLEEQARSLATCIEGLEKEVIQHGEKRQP